MHDRPEPLKIRPGRSKGSVADAGKRKGVDDMKRYCKTILTVGAALVLLATVAGVARAQNARRMARAQAGAADILRPATWLRGLDLTAEQKDQIKTIIASHKDQIKTVRQANAEARKALRTARVEGADLGSLKTAYDRVSNAGWDALVLRNTIGSEIKGVLTPDQQAKLQKRLRFLETAGQRLRNRKIR
jgi:Spy/CpxP family protein refolding chaperone